MQADWRSLCRGDVAGLLQGLSRFESRAGFRRGLRGYSRRDLRGELRSSGPRGARQVLSVMYDKEKRELALPQSKDLLVLD